MTRVALLDPVGDAGIGGYTHELAQALGRAGVDVDVYTSGRPFAQRLERSYALIPVFGGEALDRGMIASGREAARATRATAPPAAPADAHTLDAYFALLAQRTFPRRAARATRSVGTGPAVGTSDPADPPAGRNALAAHLRDTAYDVVWTQWPDLRPYADDLRESCAVAGIQVVHTVHNVLPHEPAAEDEQRHAAVYGASDALIVHSRQAAAALASAFPQTAARIVESKHGTYTLYPRIAGARERVRALLHVPPDTILALVFGGVRPYKNIEAVMGALRDPSCGRVILVIAGWEWGYPDAVAGDRLSHMRQLAHRLGVAERVRLLPGPFGIAQTAALFEASDVVAAAYRESSGSGVLCLGMTFQRHILCTRTGGMDEYFDDYAARTIIESADETAVAHGLAAAADAIRAGPCPPVPPALHWDSIVAALLQRVTERAPPAPRAA